MASKAIAEPKNILEPSTTSERFRTSDLIVVNNFFNLYSFQQ